MPARVNPGRQRGQAMVEFAVILIVLVMLVAGGAELALAGLNSSRTTEGAKAGAGAWLEMGGNLTYGTGPSDGSDLVGASGAIPNGVYGLGGSEIFHDEGDHDVFGLGDHDTPGSFMRPTCGTPDTGFNHAGLPSDADDAPDATHPLAYVTGDVYLFNPKPIDVTYCGQGGVNLALKALIERLPPVNRAMYSLYERHVVSEGEEGCGAPLNYSTPLGGKCTLLMLPGRWDSADDITRLAYLDIDSVTEQATLRDMTAECGDTTCPVFQLQCAPQGGNPQDSLSCDSRASPGDVCWESATNQRLPCEVRVVMRFQNVFESLVLLGMGTADSSGNGAHVDEGGADFQSLDQEDAGNDGNLGKEVVALGSQRKLKPQKKFKGCYQTVGGGNDFNSSRATVWNCN